MKIKALGFNVIVEMEVVEEVSEGGIVLPSDLIAKEQDATDVGYIRDIGPTAWDGYPGCDKEGKTPAECWGIEIGMKVEYRRFEGKKSAHPDYPNHRYIPDSHIIGAIL